MTTVSLNLEWSYSIWYEKAVDYVFDFFEDPLYSDAHHKDLLSRLLLDPKTILLLLVYVAYQGKRLLDVWSSDLLRKQVTNVTILDICQSTVVSKTCAKLDTFVNAREITRKSRACFHLFSQIQPKLNVFLTATSSSHIRGWAILRIFRPLKPINLDNYLKQWKNIIAPFFLSGFRYYLIGPKSPVNMPFSGSSFC